MAETHFCSNLEYGEATDFQTHLYTSQLTAFIKILQNNARYLLKLQRRFPGISRNRKKEIELAGLSPAAVLCELTNEDGTMSRLPELIDFARRKELTLVTIEDIFQYRIGQQASF